MTSTASAEVEPIDRSMHEHLAHAADTLGATDLQFAGTLSAEELVIVLADLATITGLVDALTAQTRHRLAAWVTVDAHLRQAQTHARDLSRCLNHACATFAFATCPPTAA